MKGAFVGLVVWMLSAQIVMATEPDDVLTPTKPPPYGQPFDMRSNMMDKGAHLITMRSNWGNITLDTLTQRAYLTRSSGVSEFSFTTGLTAARYNPADFNFNNAYPGLDRPILSLEDGLHQPFGPCDLSPCQEQWDPIDGNFIKVPIIGYNMPPAPDANLTGDMRAFSNWRQGRCDAFNESVLNSSLEAPATATVCAMAETPITAAACGGALIKQAYDASKRVGQGTDCNASYPGPGKWPGSTLPQGYGQ